MNINFLKKLLILIVTSMQAFGTNNAQYVGTANLKVTEKENKLLKNKDSFNINLILILYL